MQMGEVPRRVQQRGAAEGRHQGSDSLPASGMIIVGFSLVAPPSRLLQRVLHRPGLLRHIHDGWRARKVTVADQDWLARRFEEHRSRLEAVAYRMLGSRSDADDAVQEAWLRLSRIDPSAVDNLGGWLTTVLIRVCLDMLRSRAAHREQPFDDHVPTSPARPNWSRPSWPPPATVTSPACSRRWIPRLCSAPTQQPSRPVPWQRSAAHPPSPINSPNAHCGRYLHSWPRHPAPSGRSLLEHRAPRSASPSGTKRSSTSTSSLTRGIMTEIKPAHPRPRRRRRRYCQRSNRMAGRIPPWSA